MTNTLGTNNNVAHFGGTSFVTPQLNGITPLTPEKAGVRVGFCDGQTYRLAKSQRSAFAPLNTSGTSNDNLYYTGNPGTVYNPKTGFDTQNGTTLAAEFANTRGTGGPGGKSLTVAIVKPSLV